MAIELAAVYVPITPSLKGAAAQIQKELGGVDVSGVGQSVGASFGQRIMGAVGTAVKVGAVAVGATIATGVGAALVKGFQRLNAIDVARAKLTGLGNDAGTVSVVMENALASVRGTAFGLGDAATVAAQLVAAQIQPGEQLQGVLKSVANSAAAAGTGLDEMGSIYAKVASLGKAQNDVLQQVADRGIPIYQSLADQMGVTTDEVFKMASAGEIGFSEFQQAMTSAAGTVADELGNTVGGSWANFIASLGRIGAGLLGGVFPKIAPAIQGITAALGPLETVATTIGERIGSFLAPAFEGLQNLLTDGIDLSGFLEMASYISPLGLAFKALQPVLPVIAQMLGQIAASVGPVLVQVAQALLPILTGIIQVVAELAAAVLPAVLPLVQMLAELFGQVLAAVLPLLTPLFELVRAILPILTGLFMSLMPVLELVVGIITAVLIPVIDALVTVLTTLINFLVSVFTGDWEGAWQGISDFFTGIWNGIVAFLTPIIQGIVSFVVSYFTNLASFWSGVWGAISDFFTNIWNKIVAFVAPIVMSVVMAVQGPIQSLQGWWNGIWNAISSFFSNIWNGMVGAVTGAVANIAGAVRTIFNAVMGVFSGIGGWLIDSGRALIQGFIDGILAMVKPVGDAVGGVIEWARGFFPNSPAKRGPLAGAGWTSLRHSGAAVIEQFGLGFGDRALAMQNAMDSFLTVPSVSSPFAGGSAGSPSTGAIYVQNPFTGEYLLSQVDDRAYAASAETTSMFTGSFRGGRRV